MMQSSIIQKARVDLEHSVRLYMSLKSRISAIVNSTDDLDQSTLKYERQKFEDALNDLNRTQTIWRCRSEDVGSYSPTDKYSDCWLESEWYE